ncbi:MAG: flagellar export protein FliJ [Rhodocyclaceae bacterium]|nr:flagellar export protein FliJ [Rhodocyclaceae bacterium]
MSENFPLQKLLDLAHERTDDAARRLGELIGAEQEDDRKLTLLRQYRDEYQARFMDAAREGIGPDAWRNFSAFIGRLDEAIEQQQRIVAQARDRTAAGQQAWIAERNRMKAFDALSQRHDRQQARKEAKRDQTLTDEHAAKLGRNREEG